MSIYTKSDYQRFAENNSPIYARQIKNLKKHILCWTDRKEYLYRKHSKRTKDEEIEFRHLVFLALSEDQLTRLMKMNLIRHEGTTQ
jgi:hypothetical protein